MVERHQRGQRLLGELAQPVRDRLAGRQTPQAAGKANANGENDDESTTGWSPRYEFDVALEEIKQQRWKQFDPVIADAFIDMMKEDSIIKIA